MTTPRPLLAVLLAGLASAALAAEASAAPATRNAAPAGAAQAGTDRHKGDNRHRLVKNTPYIAQVVTERTQLLNDGNHISTHHNTMSYRDSAGRTRHEIPNDKGEIVTVVIRDPVAGTMLVLKPQERTVTRIERGGDGGHGHPDAPGKGARPGSVPTLALPEGGHEIIAKRVERTDGDGRPRSQENVRIQASDAGTTTTRDAQAQMASMAANAISDAKWAAKATTKDLGKRDFNGIKAEGKLRSYEIPAGEIGNRAAIVVADETWFAPELQVAVYTKHSDPRSGDFVFRLDGIKREEPPAALFVVPADYTVKEALGQGRDKGKMQ